MPNTLPTLYCPNLKCRAKNTELDPFCQTCGTALPKRYLWVIGATGKAGETLEDRYVFRGPRVVLDTQVGLPLKLAADLPTSLVPYLKLFPFRLHLPQLYTVIPPRRKKTPPIVLLEQAPLYAADFFAAQLGADSVSMPLSDSWIYARPLRQINWLWQMAQLWQPMVSQGVASSLLQPNLLRVEERLLRVLELQPDFETIPTLADLGVVWQQWLPETSEALAPDFDKLCQALMQGSISTPELLLDQLERLLVRYQESYQLKIDISARTDTGPMRDHNEDACYPNHSVIEQNSQERLAVVCDGVGGHDGGEVASGIAIEAMTSHLTQLQQGALPTDVVIAELEAATYQANDLISQRNDDEQRQDRQRMGTTLVTTLVHNQQAYVTHIGDSRAYLITGSGCYQLTVDDDIASREVRLGYIPYREALKQPASGSLTQALGMASSAVLRPSVQRLILDEDCVLLLCSDGLSDYDRVETLWRTEVLPLLHQETDLVTVTKRLIDQANQLNGHDNVTVAILHCRVAQPPHTGPTPPPRSTQLQAATTISQESTVPRETASQQTSGTWRLWAIAGLFGALVLGGLAYFLWPKSNVSPSSESSTTPTVVETPPQLTFENLGGEKFLEVQANEALEAGGSRSVRIWQERPASATEVEGSQETPLSAGKLVTVLALHPSSTDPEAAPASASADQWVKIRICPLASPAPEGAVSEATPELSAKDSSQELEDGPGASSSPSPSPEAQPESDAPPTTSGGVVEGWVAADAFLPQVQKSTAPVEEVPVCGRSTNNAGGALSGNTSL